MGTVYTALSAHVRTFASGLVEALTQVESDDTSVLYVAYDIQARGPLAHMAPSESMLGLALVLAPRPSNRARALLRWGTRAAESPRDTPAASQHLARLGGNAMAACLPLVEALASATPADLTYALGPSLALDLRVAPTERSA